MFVAYWFARDVEGADVQKLSDFVLNSGNQIYIKEFYQIIPHNKFDATKFETYLTFM